MITSKKAARLDIDGDLCVVVSHSYTNEDVLEIDVIPVGGKQMRTYHVFSSNEKERESIRTYWENLIKHNPDKFAEKVGIEQLIEWSASTNNRIEEFIRNSQYVDIYKLVWNMKLPVYRYGIGVSHMLEEPEFAYRVK